MIVEEEEMRLECVVCGSEMDNFMSVEDGMQPTCGLAFETMGHYGSAYFDPMDGSKIELSICDPCVSKLVDRGVARVYPHSRANRQETITMDDEVEAYNRMMTAQTPEEYEEALTELLALELEFELALEGYV